MKRREIPRPTIERACRMYKTNTAASKALGFRNNEALKVRCKELGIETPMERKER